MTNPTNATTVPSVSITTARTGASARANELGMRAMQERAWARRGEQYLLIKSPPASGKSRALMFIALAALREHKRLGAEELARHIQRDPGQAKRTLERLVETGLVEAHGNTRGRSYTLSVDVYRAKGDKLAYTRQVGFSDVQHPEMIMNFVRQHGRIRRSEVMELCHLSAGQAGRLLARLKEEGRLAQQGERRWAFYTVGDREGL